MSTGPVAGEPVAPDRVQFLLARHAVYDGPKQQFAEVAGTHPGNSQEA